MDRLILKKTLCFTLLALFSVSAVLISSARCKGVKTSYKRYSIFKVKNEDILCEPYTVSKDDWLYKIFRKKGEISEKDFPYFLMVFQKINPEISNIDAIEPGIHILIPLKKVQKKDYDQSTPGTVDVPVIEFSTINDDLDLDPFLKKHTVKKGDNISSLIDKEFLGKGGSISEEGLKAFQLANPNVKNINIVYEGTDIFLPDPSIKSEPWFQSFLSKKPEAPEGSEGPEDPTEKPLTTQGQVDAYELLQLKKYSSLVGGTLLSHGKMYFPQKDGGSLAVDLSNSPMIETRDGSKILILSGENVNQQLLESVQQYWKSLKVQLMADTLDEIKDSAMKKTAAKPSRTTENKKMVEALLFQTGYDYIPNAKIPFTLNKIQLEASFGRIIREESTDILINYGNVYGAALDVLKKKEFEIISIPAKSTVQEVGKKLFSSLGYSIWINPSFHTGEIVETINGLYATKDNDKLFMPEAPLTIQAATYLKNENIKLLTLKNASPAPLTKDSIK